MKVLFYKAFCHNAEMKFSVRNFFLLKKISYDKIVLNILSCIKNSIKIFLKREEIQDAGVGMSISSFSNLTGSNWRRRRSTTLL